MTILTILTRIWKDFFLRVDNRTYSYNIIFLFTEKIDKWILSPKYLKVSKFQKQFFLKLHCPKNEKNIDKILPYEARAEFCQIFRSFFWAMEFQEKLLLRFTDL